MELANETRDRNATGVPPVDFVAAQPCPKARLALPVRLSNLRSASCFRSFGQKYFRPGRAR